MAALLRFHVAERPQIPTFRAGTVHAFEPNSARPPLAPMPTSSPTHDSTRDVPAAVRLGKLVLVVEDDDDLRFMYTECLEQLGYRAVGEADGTRGLEAAFQLRPDAVVLDVVVPGFDGIEATRRLRADPRTSGCIIVVVTGRGMERMQEATDAGCDAFICKPFDASALDLALRARVGAGDVEPTFAVQGDVIKRCACGRDLTRKQWLALPMCGRMQRPHRRSHYELRNCTCGSTLAVESDALHGPTPGSLGALDEHAEASARKTLYVVDRDPHVRHLVQQFVGNRYGVEFFDDGGVALDRVRTSPPAVLVTEILVPRLDGLALCRLIKGDPTTHDVPVLVFSILAADERAMAAGADAFLGKPLERESLIASLRDLTLPPHDPSTA